MERGTEREREKEVAPADSSSERLEIADNRPTAKGRPRVLSSETDSSECLVDQVVPGRVCSMNTDPALIKARSPEQLEIIDAARS